ncbi:MAG: hypothetical protein WBI06_11160 [Paludibacter sp.]
MKKLKHFLIILVSISLCFISCSDDLSRRKAKDIILNQKNAGWYTINLSPIYNAGLNSYTFWFNKNYEQKLLENGFIKFEMNYFGLDYYSLTDKILQYKITGQSENKIWFKLADLYDINITGITGNDTYKHVEFNISYTPTDLGKYVLYTSELTKTGSLTFEKYDDGWRLK